jgi:hypothetical protein
MSYYNHYWLPKPSQRSMLSESIGGIDYDIVKLLFSFEPSRLNLFFDEYEKHYGRSATNYARQNFTAWKTRKKSYNVKSIQKFVKIAPIFLTYDQRYELIKKLYSGTKLVESHTISVVLGHSEHKLAELDKLFAHFCNKPMTHQLSGYVRSVLDWVTNHDSEQARKIIAAIETEQSLIVSRAAKSELERLRRSIAAMDSSAVGTHSIALPYGSIVVVIRHPTLSEKISKFFR